MDPPTTAEVKKFYVRATELGREAPDFLKNKSLMIASFWREGRKLILTLEEYSATLGDHVHGASSRSGNAQPMDDSGFNEGESVTETSGGVQGAQTAPGGSLFPLFMEVDYFRSRKLGWSTLLVRDAHENPSKKFVLHFASVAHCEQAVDMMQRARAEESGQFLSFEHFGSLFNHRTFLSDSRRLRIYREAMQNNWGDFYQKAVLDVGCGLGVLSIFAARAGARKVYAVDPADIAILARNVVRENDLSNIIEIHQARVESVELPEMVDTIVCDCFGEMLLNGQMLTSLLNARRRFLKPGGKIYPAKGKLRLRPFNDTSFEAEAVRENSIWTQTHPGQGLFSADLFKKVIEKRYSRPDLRPQSCNPTFASCHEQEFYFGSLTPDKLQQIAFPFVCYTHEKGCITGFTFSFGIEFIGEHLQTSLDSEFTSEAARWHNVFCLVPIKVHVGSTGEVRGNCQILANEYHSYDIVIEFRVQTESYKYKYRLEYGSAIAKNV